MTKMHKLGMFLHVTVFSLLICFTSCFQPIDSHESYIDNQTQDTLFPIIVGDFKSGDSTRRIITNLMSGNRILVPGKNFYGNGGKLFPHLDILGKETDTLLIYRADTLVIKWGGPLREMDKSINHFYNKNSWEIVMGGHKNEWERATFTIRESDIGVIEGKK